MKLTASVVKMYFALTDILELQRSQVHQQLDTLAIKCKCPYRHQGSALHSQQLTLTCIHVIDIATQNCARVKKKRRQKQKQNKNKHKKHNIYQVDI